MAKIRGVKPELWTDIDFIELSPLARLLWIGMWNFACDNGHLQDKTKQLKMRILPTDDVNCAELVAELVEHHRVERVDGWLIIPNFAAHQKPNKRYWTTCDMPGCDRPDGDPQREIPGAQVGTKLHKGAPTFASADGDGDGDGDGEGDVKVSTSFAANAPTKKAPKRATSRPDDFRPSQAHVDLAAERGVDLHTEWANFCDWTDANGKTYKDWPAALRTWIRRARPTLGVASQPSRVQQHLALAHKLAAEDGTPRLEGLA